MKQCNCATLLTPKLVDKILLYWNTSVLIIISATSHILFKLRDKLLVENIFYFFMGWERVCYISWVANLWSEEKVYRSQTK